MTHSPSILVVEDDISTRTILTTLLEDEGYHVAAFQDAAGAVNHIVTDSTIDVVVSDLRLPDGSGLQILWTLNKVYPRADFILITGYAALDNAIEALNQGAFPYHVKPLDIDALKGSVRNALRQQRLAKELEEKNVELELASAAKTLILSTVSHELKTPLTSVVGYTCRLLYSESVGPLNERQRSYIEIIRDDSLRLMALIEDLLDIS